MLMPAEKDDGLELHFRAAYFEQQKLNEACLSISNAADSSSKGCKSRVSKDSLLPLRQQLALLQHHLTMHENDSVALQVFSDLHREYSVGSVSYIVPSNAENPLHQIDTVFSSFTGYDKNLADSYVNELNSKLEGLLKPPQTVANGASIDLTAPIPASTSPAMNGAFVTAKSMMPAGSVSNNRPAQSSAGPKSLGVNKRPRTANPPGRANQDKYMEEISSNYGFYNQRPAAGPVKKPMPEQDEPVDERLAGIEGKLVEMIKNEIQHKVDHISWDDIAGLKHAKDTIKEIVIWPMLRPDIFTGLRGPPKGLLLFGPPGTGKTLIGKCIANEAKATFFSISASSLTSKWVGEGEKLVRALFAVARCCQPSVIFIDEIDSLLTQRTDGEFEASRRIKTEFLVQFDGASTSSEDRILVIGATNRPQEIDEAARRRLVKRLYIPLPDGPARIQIVRNLLQGQKHDVTESDLDTICQRTDGYSGSDMDNLCREAALGPIRSIRDIMNIDQSAVRAICLEDFDKALTQVRASVSRSDLAGYLDWNSQFGSIG